MRLVLIAIAVLTGCMDRPIDLPEDVIPPAIVIRANPNGDEDGDGLVDIHISWSPTDGVDTSKTVIGALDGDSVRNVNLFRVWRSAVTDTGMVVHETLERMLSFGEVRLEIQVSDEVGNVAIDTVHLDLPPGKLIKTLRTARSGTTTDRAYDIAICEGMGYMPAGPYMVVFDPDSMSVVAEVRNPNTLLELNHLVCANDGTVYVTPRVHRFDRATLSWLPSVPGTYEAHAIATSRARPDRLFIGERGGGIASFDASNLQRTGHFESWSRFHDDYVFAISVLPNDEKLYFTRAYEGGILVADPHSGKVIRRIHVGGNSPFGSTHDLVLNAASDRMYAAVRDGAPRGVAVINTQSDVILLMIQLEEYVPQGIALSPSGRRLFVTTQDKAPESPSDNVLIDLKTNAVIQRFPRPRNGGRFDNRLEFHPNGKLIFVVRNLDIDVYLNRE